MVNKCTGLMFSSTTPFSSRSNGASYLLGASNGTTADHFRASSSFIVQRASSCQIWQAVATGQRSSTRTLTCIILSSLSSETLAGILRTKRCASMVPYLSERLLETFVDDSVAFGLVQMTHPPLFIGLTQRHQRQAVAHTVSLK